MRLQVASGIMRGPVARPGVTALLLLLLLCSPPTVSADHNATEATPWMRSLSNLRLEGEAEHELNDALQKTNDLVRENIRLREENAAVRREHCLRAKGKGRPYQHTAADLVLKTHKLRAGQYAAAREGTAETEEGVGQDAAEAAEAGCGGVK